MQGDVIGISTAGFNNGQNLNLAVPYDTIRLVANSFF
jgi:S1-C subfamily serine protease